MNFWEVLFIQPLVNALLIFYKLFGNLGLSIIALTFLIKLLLMPLTLPSMRAMQAMRELAPELEKIKKRHKDDKTRLAQAQADLYKSKGVNPASGCLPQILQLVLLFALFGVFNLTAGGNPGENFNRLAYPGLKLTGELNSYFLYLDLTKPDTIRLPGLPIPLPGAILVLSALLQLASSKMLMPSVLEQKKKASATKGELDDAMAVVQQQMLYLFPVLTVVIGYSFASGLVLYWLVLSAAQAAQQYYTSGWGGLNPWIIKLGLVKSPERQNGKK